MYSVKSQLNFLPFYAQDGSSTSLELDLEQYLVPAPETSENSGPVYAANMTESPRSFNSAEVMSNTDGSGSASPSDKDGRVSIDQPATIKVVLVSVLHVCI